MPRKYQKEAEEYAADNYQDWGRATVLRWRAKLVADGIRPHLDNLTGELIEAWEHFGESVNPVFISVHPRRHEIDWYEPRFRHCIKRQDTGEMVAGNGILSFVSFSGMREWGGMVESLGVSEHCAIEFDENNKKKRTGEEFLGFLFHTPDKVIGKTYEIKKGKHRRYVCRATGDWDEQTFELCNPPLNPFATMEDMFRWWDTPQDKQAEIRDVIARAIEAQRGDVYDQ